MRIIDGKELDLFDYNNEDEEGCVLQEATIQELADGGYGTACGHKGNTCFAALAQHFGNRLVRGWMHNDEKTVWGMVHIQCNEEEGEEIERIAGEEADGSLRLDGMISDVSDFCVFEVE